MSEGAASLQVQQLLELLATMTSLSDETAAVQAAAERAAMALEAEVCAVTLGEQVSASVGYPAGSAPSYEDLRAVADRKRDHLDVPGLGVCPAISAVWSGTSPGSLVIARWSDDPFTAGERTMVRGMARTLELTLRMLRTLQAETEMRERSERQAAENARLAESLREQQHLLMRLSSIQRAISRREPLEQILETITAAAHELLGDEVVGLWMVDQDVPDRAKLRSAFGLSMTRLPALPLNEAGAAGEAMRHGDVVVLQGYEHASPSICELTGGRLRASMAVPVHENNQIVGGLMVASYRPERTFSAKDEQTLRTFAENVSLALTDAHTLKRVHLAVHDTLTGLASRGLFLERLTEQSATGEPGALLFVDLDRFKQVNDTFGHAAGDRLLVTTAERIRSELRGCDLAGRFGGDEFAVLMRGAVDEEAAVGVGERLVRSLSEPILIDGRRVSVGASVGIALSMPGEDPAELMRRADIAMYQAKRNGRDRCEVFTEAQLLDFVASS
ncbi:MAG TPA: sensor domain-containing diguanylate cyclase [Actinoplanes sp.]|jgi:diguanylate cyclase (GGDEF)-like protein